MKLTKKFTAVLLSVLMMLSVPVTASAAEYDISITTAQGIDYLYAEQSYTLTAEIKNASKSDAEAATEFVWSSPTVSSLQTSGNKSITENSDGTTYTVRQSARITMPAAGTKFDVTAKYGSSSKTISITSKQPITSFDFTSEQTDYSYYSATNNTIYVDRKVDKASYTKYFNLTVNNFAPAENDDLFNAEKISINASKSFEIQENGTNSFKIFAPHNLAPGKFQLTISTFSGSTSKNCNVQVCVPEEDDYKLNAKSNGINVAESGAMAIVQGKPETITTVFNTKDVNDDMRFTLVNSNGDPTPAEYCTTDGTTCTLNVTDQGTYYLHCKNISKDNGMLKRELPEKVITVNVLKAVPINSIVLYKLDDEGNRTSLPLTEATLYSETSDESKRTLALENSIVCDPTIDNTTGDSIYFESDNPKVATVDANGKIEAKGKGTTIIWVRSTDNAKAYATVNVTVKIGTTSLSISKEDGGVTIPAGHTEKMAATRNADADDELYWYSDNAEVLSINSKTGEITANKASDTPVVISARADSGIEKTTKITVVPAVRAASVTLTAKAYNNDRTESTSSSVNGKTYSDYFVTKHKYFVVNATTNPAEECNDVLVWSISFNNGVGLSFDEAVEEGLITYKKNTTNQYEITPLILGNYSVSCVSTINANNIQNTDATDSINIEMLETANSISVTDEATEATLSKTVYIPIGESKKILVKTSTANNNKKIDPPIYTITSGNEYISVSQAASEDGEGIVYTIKGLEYSTKASSITFSSKSLSVSNSINIYVRNNLNDTEVNGVEENVTYTGSALTFSELELLYNGTKLDKSQYKAEYKNNTNAGIASITLTGLGNFAGSTRIIEFNILPKPFDDTVTIASIPNVIIDASNPEATPTPAVKFGTKTLVKDKDYKLSYKNNTTTGTGTITVTGINNYSGSVSADFKVYKRNDMAASITVKDAGTDTNTSSSINLPIGDKKIVTVKTSTSDNNKKADPPVYTITEGSEFISISQKESDDGEGITYTISSTGVANTRAKIVFSSKSNSVSKTFTIYVRNNLNGDNVEVKGVPESAAYTGSKITFDDIAVYVNGSSIDSSQYSVKYTDNINVGTAVITITGKNDFLGSKREVKFKITPLSITGKAEIDNIKDQYLSTKTRAAEPYPYVYYNDTRLKLDRDYTVSYKNNTKAGTATLTVTGKGNYTGTASKNFKVCDIADYFTVSAIPVQTYYNGKEIKPVPTVKYKGTILKLNKDFELSYSNNVYSGYATVTIKGIGYYTGSISRSFTIKPKTAKLKKVKKGKKKFTAKWKKLSDISGYQVMYARDKKFKKSKKSVTVADSNASSTVVSKLKKKKTYYVRVRGYKIVSGKTIYGNWSKTKKVKVK